MEVLERKGLCTKQDRYDVIIEFRGNNPPTSIPELYLRTETENTIIDSILELPTRQGLTSHQSKTFLERLGRIIEMGQQVAKGTTRCVQRIDRNGNREPARLELMSQLHGEFRSD